MDTWLAWIRGRLRQAGLLDPALRSNVTMILWLSAFLLTFNLYLLATVLPSVVRDLHTTVGAVESALILFPLLSGLLVPAGRRLPEGHGMRRTAMWALLIYGAGQLLAAARSSVAILTTGGIRLVPPAPAFPER